MDYRVYVPRVGYRGQDKRKLEKLRRDAALCAEIEVVLRRRYDEIKPGEMRSIFAHEVAREIGADFEQVRRVMCRVQGVSNGVTFGKAPMPGQPWTHECAATKPTPKDQTSSQDTTRDGRLSLYGRARHAKFGEGIIVHILWDQVAVEFDLTGSKRVMASFLEPVQV